MELIIALIAINYDVISFYDSFYDDEWAWVNSWENKMTHNYSALDKTNISLSGLAFKRAWNKKKNKTTALFHCLSFVS